MDDKDPIEEARKFRGGILIVTDRYPPNAHGGAELSLHIMLSGLDNKADIVVLTFNESTSTPRFYELDGVNVVEFPYPVDWPYHQHSIAEFEKLQARPRGIRGLSKLWWLAEYCLAADPRSVTRRLRMLYQRFLVGVRGGVPADFEQFDNSLRRRMVQSIVAAMQPRLIHADNYRSMLTVASLAEETDARLVGLVRDNRFYCMTPSQSMMVNGKVCGACDFECYDARQKNIVTVKELLGLNRAYRQAALRKFDRVVVTSEFLQTQISSIVDPARIAKVANPADSPELVYQAARGIAELPGFNILVVGMLNENKGQMDIVQNLDKLVAAIPDAHVYFAGRGERIEKRIHEVAQEKGFPDRVEVLGYLGRDELYQWMRRCQVVGLPTLWPEPFGRVPLEAGLSARPVVAYRIGGLKETILHERTGLLVEHQDMDGFIAALKRLADDPGLGRRMGYAAYETIPRLYQAEQQAGQIGQIWKELAV